MPDKRRKPEFVHNRFDMKTYTKVLAISSAIVLFIYIRYFATFSIAPLGDYVKLFVLVVILGGSLWKLSCRLHRNVIGIVTISVLPVLLYDAVTMWKYETQVRVLIPVGATVICIIAVISSFVKSKSIRRSGLKRRVFIETMASFCRVFGCVLLLACVICGKRHIQEQHSLWYNQVIYNASDNKEGVWDYENSLEANIEEVAQLDPLGGWHDLSLESKVKVLETCIRILTRYYGLDSAPALEIVYMDEHTLGQYDREKDCVKLSYKYIVDTNADGYSILRVLCHEMYHKYQRSMVDLLNEIRNSEKTEKYANLLLLYAANVYESEMNHYISGDDGEIAYYLYASQQLERDAERYADKLVNEFYEGIQEYWSYK